MEADADVKANINEIVNPQELSFLYFWKPAHFTKVVTNTKKVFAVWALIGYLGQFLLVVSAINLYSDSARNLKCGSSLVDPTEDPALVYDTALKLLAVYHIIEWVKFTLFLTIAFIGVNLMHVWYILCINSLFGIAAYITCHVQRFNDDGKACADVQSYRSGFLLAEVIIFWLTFVIMSVPQLFFFCMKKDNLYKATSKREDDSENEDDVEDEDGEGEKAKLNE